MYSVTRRSGEVRVSHVHLLDGLDGLQGCVISVGFGCLSLRLITDYSGPGRNLQFSRFYFDVGKVFGRAIQHLPSCQRLDGPEAFDIEAHDISWPNEVD